MTQVDQTFTIEGDDPVVVDLARKAGLTYVPTEQGVHTARAALGRVKGQGAVLAALAGVAYADGETVVYEIHPVAEWQARRPEAQAMTLLHLRERAAREAAQQMRGLVGPDAAYLEVRPLVVGDPDAAAVRFPVDQPLPATLDGDTLLQVTYACPTRPLMQDATRT